MSIVFPIILTIVIVMWIVVFIRINKKSRLVTVKITHLLLMIYGAVLLLSMFLVTFIADNPALGREKVENWKEERNWSNLYNTLHEGKIDQLESRNLLYEKTINYGEQSLVLQTNDGSGSNIFVERKDVDDGKIEVFVFTSGLIVAGYDFSDKLIPYQFQLDGETLKVLNPQNRIEISIMREEFTINQFTGQRPINDVSSMELEVYLKIPKSLQLNDGGNVFIQYVNQ